MKGVQVMVTVNLQCNSLSQINSVFLNQARTWFLKIDIVQMSVCVCVSVCVYVCPPPRLLKTIHVK